MRDGAAGRSAAPPPGDSHVTSITYGTDSSCSSPPNNLGNLTYTYDADGRVTVKGGSLAAVTLPGNVAGGSSTTYLTSDAARGLACSLRLRLR